MRLAFMGTPQFAVPALSELIAAGHEIVAVYTQPPKRSGRGQKMQRSPVHIEADNHQIEVRSPANFKRAEDRQAFIDLELDVAIVVAYGLILPEMILQSPKYGCLNLHGSLLPRWRGAAPIQRALMAGDTETGIQLMQMEKGLDTGPILLSESIPITSADTSRTVHDQLSYIGADMVPRALAALSRGGLTAVPQSSDGVQYANKISPEEAKISWNRPAQEVDCHIRGLSPFPGAWFEIDEESGETIRCKVLMSSVIEDTPDNEPGTVTISRGEITVTCFDGAVRLEKIQRPGKTIQPAEEFLRGFSIANGQILG